MDRRVQLLAHAGASSSHKDDESYMAQAASYLDLSTSSVSKVISFRSNAVAEEPEPAQPREDNALKSNKNASSQGKAIITESFDVQAYFEDTQLAYTALESQLFTSSAVIRATPVRNSGHIGGDTPFIVTSTNKVQAPRSSDSSQVHSVVNGLGLDGRTLRGKRPAQDDSEPSNSKPRSESLLASQSSRMRSPMYRRSPKRIRFNRSSSSSSQRSIRTSMSRDDSASANAPPWTVSKQVSMNRNQDAAEDTVTTDETVSELPASYSLSDVSPDSLKEQHSMSGNPVSYRGSAAHTFNQSLDHVGDPQQGAPDSPIRDAVEAPCAERTSDLRQPENDDLPTSQLVTTDTSNNVSNRALVQDYDTESEAKTVLKTLAVEIRPRPAATSVKAFTTHITDMLRTVAENPAIVNKFEPVSVRREIAVHERGHWLIDWSKWPSTKQLDLWRALEVYVGNGNAGSSVWCTRAADESCDDERRKTVTQSTIDDDAPAQSDMSPFTVVRVYCWGEIVRHVYLLLYALSCGSVRKLGLQWTDAEGKVVVQMKGPIPVIRGLGSIPHHES